MVGTMTTAELCCIQWCSMGFNIKIVILLDQQFDLHICRNKLQMLRLFVKRKTREACTSFLVRRRLFLKVLKSLRESHPTHRMRDLKGLSCF